MFSTRRNQLTTFLFLALCIIHCGNSQDTSNKPSTTQGNSNNTNSGPSTTAPTITKSLTALSTTQSSQGNNGTKTSKTTIQTPISNNTKNFSTLAPVTEKNVNSSSNSSTNLNETSTSGSTIKPANPTTTVSIGSSSKQSTSPKTTVNGTEETTTKPSTQTPKGTKTSAPSGTTPVTPVTNSTTQQPSMSSTNTTSKVTSTTSKTTVKNNGTAMSTPEIPSDGSTTVTTTTKKSVSTTALVTTTNQTTVKPTNATTVQPAVSTINQTSKPPPVTTPPVTTPTAPPVTTTNQTTKGSTGTATSKNPTMTHTNKPVTEPPGAQFVYINEIIVNKQGIFQKIEIQISNQLDLTHYAIVMVDGNTNKTLSVFYLRNGNKVRPGLLMVQFNSSSTLSNKGIGIAIYDTRHLTSGDTFNEDWNVNEAGLIDALVIGKTYEDISASLVNILTPGVDPFILDPSKYGQDRSISRCSNGTLRSTEMYAFINPSMGIDNRVKCTEREHFQNTLSIKMKMDCGKLRYANNTINEHLMRQIIKLVVRDVNRKCQCGITRMHVEDPTVQCCTDTVLDMKFVAPNELQDKEFLKSFKAFIGNTNNIEVNDQTYTLDQRCLNDCCNQVILPLSKKDNSKDVRVTVAVIVTLLVLFLIIVLVVYLYMRKKKLAVQQFRMSRLEEDYEDFDDMTVGITNDDHDEFVGGQEATFDLKA